MPLQFLCFALDWRTELLAIVWHPSFRPILKLIGSISVILTNHCLVQIVLYSLQIVIHSNLEKEGETIRINVKNKPSSGTGMLSAAGLSGGVSGTAKPKTLGLAPPPSGAAKIRSPLPPPPNDAAATRMVSASHGTALKGANKNSRHLTDALSDLTQLEKNLPSTAGSGSTKNSASGWAAF